MLQFRLVLTSTLFLLLSLTSIAQDSLQKEPVLDYERDTRFFVGANFGATYTMADVDTRVRGGWALFAGYNFMKKSGSPVSIGLRARFAGLNFEGQESEKFRGIVNDPVYSSIPYYRDSLGWVIRNYKTEVYEGSIDLSLHLHSLHERTGLDLYGFVGGGLAGWDAVGNLFSDTSAYEWDKIEDSLGGTITPVSLISVMDPTFDTPLEGSSRDKRNISFMPSFGLGVGYQMSPNFSIGIEHRVTLTLTDLFEGSRWNDDNTLSSNKDIYHFTSFWLRFNILKKDKNYELEELGIEDESGPREPDYSGWHASAPPTVRVVVPEEKRMETSSALVRLLVDIQQVKDPDKVFLWVNGSSTRNFQWNPERGELEAELELEEGSNIIEISASNKLGKAQADLTIVYYPPAEVFPPSVELISPVGIDSVSSESVAFIAKVDQVLSTADVVVRVNGQVLEDIVLDKEAGRIEGNLPLRVGGNVVEVVVTNKAGMDTKTFSLFRKE